MEISVRSQMYERQTFFSSNFLSPSGILINDPNAQLHIQKFSSMLLSFHFWIFSARFLTLSVLCISSSSCTLIKSDAGDAGDRMFLTRGGRGPPRRVTVGPKEKIDYVGEVYNSTASTEAKDSVLTNCLCRWRCWAWRSIRKWVPEDWWEITGVQGVCL